MRLNEHHHAIILDTCFKTLRELRGERGIELFRLCARAYGERRGRRMAMRALRDGNPLDMTSYFAYGELLSTEGSYIGTYDAYEGFVIERQTQCPWCTAFRTMDGHDCAVCYCREIDGAIVRGFNPDLGYELIQNMHTAGSCEFIFKSPEIRRDFMETYSDRLDGRPAPKIEMTYHCADVYHTFKRITSAVLTQDEQAALQSALRTRLGDEAMAELEAWPDELFETPYDK